MPLPNVVIANGKIPFELLSKSYYPKLRQAEAIRQLYLNKFMATNVTKETNKILFVAGSYDRCETKSLLSLVYQAFPKARDFAIWFKGSPVNPLAPLFKELGVDVEACGYYICDKSLDALLPKIKVALVANTAVAIEAAAFGAHLIVPLLADTMLMNPIVETTYPYHTVSHPDELRVIVCEQMANEKTQDINKKIIAECWTLTLLYRCGRNY